MEVGFQGLGIMGKAMAMNLLKSGYKVTVWNRTLSKDLGAMANPMFKMKGPSMLNNSYSPAFPLKHQHKDMRLALALGDENAVSKPVAAVANEAFKKARSMGLGDVDFSAVHEAVKAPKH